MSRYFVSTRIPGTPFRVGRGFGSGNSMPLSDGSKGLILIWAVFTVLTLLLIPPVGAFSFLIVGPIVTIACAIFSLRAAKRAEGPEGVQRRAEAKAAAGERQRREGEAMAARFNERLAASNRRLEARNAAHLVTSDERRAARWAARRVAGKRVNEKRAQKVEARVAARSNVAAAVHLTAQDRSWLTEHGWTPPE